MLLASQSLGAAKGTSPLSLPEEADDTDKLRLTYFKEGDIGNDSVWDIWRVDGPAFSWFFRGSPHVHTWLNVARKA